MFLFHLHIHHQRSTVVVSIHAARNSSFLHHVAQEASVLRMRVLAFRVSAQLPPLMTKDSQGFEMGFKKSSSLVGALTKKGGSMMNNGVCGVTKSFSYGGNSPNWTSEIVHSPKTYQNATTCQQLSKATASMTSALWKTHQTIDGFLNR